MTARLPDIQMRHVCGTELRVAHWPAEQENGKRPLLFFNGIGANLELVFKLGDKIRDRDILTFDVPGIGGSPAPRFPYRAWQLARWAKKLTEQYGFDTLDVMGVSWGRGAGPAIRASIPRDSAACRSGSDNIGLDHGAG